MRRVLVAILCSVIAGVAFASQEHAARIAEFSITWEGDEGAGPITARGARRPDGSLQRFTVSAFGRTIEMPAPVMAELSNIHFNGVLLSDEAGYPELGGRTAYLQFVVGFTSGVTSRVVVAVDEKGNVRLLQGDPPR